MHRIAGVVVVKASDPMTPTYRLNGLDGYLIEIRLIVVYAQTARGLEEGSRSRSRSTSNSTLTPRRPLAACRAHEDSKHEQQDPQA